MFRRILIASALFLVLTHSSVPALAEEAPPSEAKDKIANDLKSAFEEANKAKVVGPADVPLGTQAVFHVPENYVYVPQPAAGQLSKALGNSSSSRLVGIAFPKADENWMAYLDRVEDGHIDDVDAKSWNADDLLSSLKSGTQAANPDRIERGFPALEVSGWIEKPNYFEDTHRLVWSARVKAVGQTGTDSANYNTYALGRVGHFELNLVSDADKIDQYKKDANALLAGLEFTPGNRYADFNPGTDRVAEYGIAALVGGVAAKKLGLYAVIAAFAAKFAKLIAIGAVALLAAIRKLFTGRSSSPTDENPAASEPL